MVAVKKILLSTLLASKVFILAIFIVAFVGADDLGVVVDVKSAQSSSKIQQDSRIFGVGCLLYAG